MTKISVASSVKHSDVRGSVEGYASQGGVSLFGAMRTAANAEEGTEYFYHPSFVGSKDRLSNFRGFYRDTDAPGAVVGLYLVNAFDTALGLGWTLSSDYQPPNEAFGGTTYNWNHVGTAKLNLVYQYELRSNGTLLTQSSNNIGVDISQNKGFVTLDGLSPLTQYSFRVRVRDVLNNWSGWSSEITVSTISPPANNTPPASPTSLAILGSGVNRTMQWIAGTDQETARNDLQYYVQVKNASTGAEVGQNIGGIFGPRARVVIGNEYGDAIGPGSGLGGGSTLTWPVQSLQSGRQYICKVICKDDGHNGAAPEYSSWSATRTFTA